jgi:hypothetical protein
MQVADRFERQVVERGQRVEPEVDLVGVQVGDIE